MTMIQTVRGVPSSRILSQRENERAVDRIEAAERSSPYCICGSHMLAVAHGDEIWLECAEASQERSGLAGILARLTALGHTRRMVLQLPTAD
jgi:hypothetical protein